MKKSELKVLLKHIIKEVKSLKVNEMIANKDKSPDFFGAVNVEESAEDDEVDKQYEPEGIFVPRGVIKLGPGVDYDTASKIARNYWDIFGEEEDDKGVWQFKTRGNAYCCAVGMFNGKPAILSKTTNPDRNNLITADEMDIPDLKEEIGNEEEFKNGDKVRLKPPYAESNEVFTLSQWDGRRGWIGDKDGRGWYVKKFQITHIGDIEEESGTGAVAGFSPPMGRRKSNEMTNPDGTYSDDMEDGCRLSRTTGLKEMTSTGAVSGYQTPAWGSKNKMGSMKAIDASEKLGFKVVKSISEEEKKL